MKRHKIRQTDQRDVLACIAQLQSIIDGLRAGTIGLQDGAEPVLLRPGGVVDFELRADQTPRKETLRMELSWRPEPVPPQATASAVALPEAAPVPEAEARPDPSRPPPLPSMRDAASLMDALETPGAELGPLSTRTLDRMATAEYQRLFETARVLGSDGQWHIDQDRLIVSLESAGVDPLTQQELYALALQADADGRASMLSERVIEAIKRVSQNPPAPDAEAAPHAETA
jgi:amphi-Trp domain-containing protein